MRIDSCRKCGFEQKEYNNNELCQVCKKNFVQFVCVKCHTVTDPQYHTHNNIIKPLEITI